MGGRATAAGTVDDAQEFLKRENVRLQALVSELRTASPSVARLADLAVWREREAFEEKKNRALALLRKKDAKIRELGEAAARHNNLSRQRAVDRRSAATAAAAGSVRSGGDGRRGGNADRGNQGPDNSAVCPVVQKLEERVGEQEQQIEALLQEVVRLRSAPYHVSDLSTTTESKGGTNVAEQTRAPGEAPPASNNSKDMGFWEQPREGERKEPPGVSRLVDDLRSRVSQLESALAEKDAVLNRAAEEYRKSEAMFAERVETLERLQETARRTVLDREERLRSAQAAAELAAVAGVVDATRDSGAAGSATKTNQAGDVHRTKTPSLGAEDQRRASSSSTSVEIPAVAASLGGGVVCGAAAGDGSNNATIRSGVGPEASRGDVSEKTKEGEEESSAAQEWWLHLAAAEKEREERERESREATKKEAVARGGGEAVVGKSGGRSGKEVLRLHRLLEEQGLEVVALRQRVLQAEILARDKSKELDQERQAVKDAKRRGTIGSKGPTSAGLEGSSLRTQDPSWPRMEEEVATLHEQGHVREALVVAREAVSALKLALRRSEGEVGLQSQLLEDERQRSMEALSRAEDLQGKFDRIAVDQTLRGVSGGAVSASALIDRFAGTLFRESRRVKVLEAEVRTMRTRCTRLARVARGDSVDGCFPAPPVTGSDENKTAGLAKEAPKLRGRAERDESWVSAGVQEAVAAMETGRRHALEEEINSLKKEVLAERRRADEAERDSKDERRLRSLATHVSGGSTSQDGNDDRATLRQELKLASSEMEALRTHNKDLRTQIQSGLWSWLQSMFETVTAHGDNNISGGGDEKVGSFDDFSGQCAAAVAALREIGVIGVDGGGDGGGFGGDGGHGGRGRYDEGSAAVELDRISSLLRERNAQVNVLTSTVEALQISPTFAPSPSKSEKIGSMSGSTSVDGGNRADSPRLRVRRDRAHPSCARDSPIRVGTGLVGDMESDGGGVGVLNHVGAQCLARRCVFLTVRLTSTIAREGKAQRRVDQLIAETARQERMIRTAKAAEADLARRNRELQIGAKKAAAALGGLRTESATRLQEAGEEASKLRRALRDAELSASDARQRLASARAEGHALAVELKSSREKHREEINRLSKEHDASLKECADRLHINDDTAFPQPPRRSNLGLRCGKRAVDMTSAAVLTSSPVAIAIAELAAQWRASWQGMGDSSNDDHNKSRRRRRRTSPALDTLCTSQCYVGGDTAQENASSCVGGGRGRQFFISERQFLATTNFLRETAVRLDTECSRAVRRARAMEWELARARNGQLDATTALEEAREDVCRLSARVAAAEAAVAATQSTPNMPCRTSTTAPYTDHLLTSFHSAPVGSSRRQTGGDGGRSGRSGVEGLSDTRGSRGEEWRGATAPQYTTAVISLLEKRIAAAVEDVIALRAVSAAATAGEAAANARAEEAEAKVAMVRANTDMLEAQLERHKVSVSEGSTAEAAEWRREIRAELGRWWQDDLLALHNGVSLDWGNAGLADEAAASWTFGTRSNNMAALGTVAGGASGSLCSGNEHLGDNIGDDGDALGECNVRQGASGEEAMAQALIAGRAEQAYLEDRLKDNERRVEHLRGETLRLRSILEQWHGAFVVPVLREKQKDGRVRTVAPGDMADAPSRAPESTSSAGTGGDNRSVLLERKLLTTTASLLGIREEAAGLRGEVASLQALVSRLREDESDTREAAGHRVEYARETARRKAEGDLREAAERLEEERERFKSQLGAAHAEILWLSGEASELKQRCKQDKGHYNKDKEIPSPPPRIGSGCDGVGDILRPRNTNNERTISPGGSRKRPADRGRQPSTPEGETKREGGMGERGILREAKREREVLQRRCNGLVEDLKEAVEAKSKAEDEQEALVQVAAKAKAEAKTAGLARENLETALKELGRLLEITREAAGQIREFSPGRASKVGDKPPSAGTPSPGRNRSKEVARRFARVMVAAKVAEADLLRRLQGASSSEADLRHRLRRRDITIEELKRDQTVSDRLERPINRGGREATIPWLTRTSSNHHQYQPLNRSLRESGSISAPDFEASATGDGSVRMTANERVSLRATVNRLELELAEAAARGEVGDAATRMAERLAYRLFEGDIGGGGESMDTRYCRSCGVKLQEEAKLSATSLAETSPSQPGRGALFLIPSVDVERKLAAAAAVAASAVEPVEEAVNTTPISTASARNGPSAVDTVGPASASASRSVGLAVSPTQATPPTPSPSAGFDAGEGGGKTSSPCPGEGLPRISSGLRSLEAHLARLEVDAACGRCRLAGSAVDGEAGGNDRGRSVSSTRGEKSASTIHIVWAEVVHELRVQVAGLRRRAESTQELLEEERGGKNEIDEEILRLRTELLKQQRSYWQATATLKERYEGALQNMKQQRRREGTSCGHGATSPLGERGRGSQRDGKGVAVSAKVSAAEGVEKTRAKSTGGAMHIRWPQKGQKQEQVESTSSREYGVEEQLRDKEEELREIRALHSGEARDVAAELARVIQAHRVRLATLEEKLRRMRRKMKAMARPKPKMNGSGSAQVGGCRGGGSGGVGGHPGVLPSDTPLTKDELLNLLAAADEEVFEAKATTQRLEYELRSKTAEVDALRCRQRGGALTAGAISTVKVCTEKDVFGDSVAAEDGVSTACFPSLSARITTGAATSSAIADGTVIPSFADVVCVARLATAEAEVETLRAEIFSAGELVIIAQREASALRLMAQRKTVDRTDEGRSREKDLQRQVSAYKREVDRLRAMTAVRQTAGKSGKVARGAGGGSAGTRKVSVEGEEEGAEEVKTRTQQLLAARLESERRWRTIIALRAAKTAQGKELERLRQEVAELEGKLSRALKDVGVKTNAARVLREKVVAFETKLTAHKVTRANAASISGPTNAIAAGHLEKDTEAEATTPQCNLQTATIRNLRAERDRLRASVRGWHGSLSKKTAEVNSQVLELKRLEQEAGTLRAAVARKDDAYQHTKKQLNSVREEYQQFKDVCQRWRADSDTKWRDLKRVSEAAVRKAKACEKSGDAAEREISALKSAFRSFLKTLWDDLRSRPPPAPALSNTGPGDSDALADGGLDRRSSSGCEVPLHRKSNTVIPGDNTNLGLSTIGGACWTEDCKTTAVSTPIRLVGNAMPSEKESRGKGGEVTEGLGKASASTVEAVVEGIVATRGRGGGRGEEPLFGELTQAEVSDIMQALCVEVGEGDSRTLSTPSPALHPLLFAAPGSSAETTFTFGELPPTSLSLDHLQEWMSPSGSVEGGSRTKATTTSLCKKTTRTKSQDTREFNGGVAPVPSEMGGIESMERYFGDNHNVEFETKEDFADRVESALSGSNKFNAFAEMLPSFCTSSFTKGHSILSEGDVSLQDQGISVSRSWEAGTEPAITDRGPLESNVGDLHTVEGHLR